PRETTFEDLLFVLLVDERHLIEFFVREVADFAVLVELAVFAEVERQPGVVALELPAPGELFVPDLALVLLGSAVALPVADVILKGLQSFVELGGVFAGPARDDLKRQQNTAQDGEAEHAVHDDYPHGLQLTEDRPTATDLWTAVAVALFRIPR